MLDAMRADTNANSRRETRQPPLLFQLLSMAVANADDHPVQTYSYTDARPAATALLSGMC